MSLIWGRLSIYCTQFIGINAIRRNVHAHLKFTIAQSTKIQHYFRLMVTAFVLLVEYFTLPALFA